MECVRVLLPALIETPAQTEMTDKCRRSLDAQITDLCVKIEEDNKRYKTRVAGVWNAFFDRWRGKDYDYLMIVANDTIADVNAIEYMVKCAKENPNAAMITGLVDRDMDNFEKNYGQAAYTSRLTEGLLDPACFILPKGIIEKVGRIDDWFPMEFVERDYIHRCKLAGYDVIQPDTPLFYHPPYAGTIGNDIDRLEAAHRRYKQKWGGDANREVFTNPFQDLDLNYTYCHK